LVADRSGSRTDYVDVLALHDPHSSDLAREDVRSAVEAVVVSGRAKAVGIAGSLEAAETAVRLELPINHIQIANNPLQPNIGVLARTLGLKSENIFITTHSAFGPLAFIRRLVVAAQSDPELEQMLRRIGYGPAVDNAIRAALIDYAFRSNPAGTILFSMFTGENLAFKAAHSRYTLYAGSARFLLDGRDDLQDPQRPCQWYFAAGTTSGPMLRHMPLGGRYYINC
jgi:hypothetical protein